MEGKKGNQGLLNLRRKLGVTTIENLLIELRKDFLILFFGYNMLVILGGRDANLYRSIYGQREEGV